MNKGILKETHSAFPVFTSPRKISLNPSISSSSSWGQLLVYTFFPSTTISGGKSKKILFFQFLWEFIKFLAAPVRAGCQGRIPVKMLKHSALVEVYAKGGPSKNQAYFKFLEAAAQPIKLGCLNEKKITFLTKFGRADDKSGGCVYCRCEPSCTVELKIKRNRSRRFSN